LIRYLISGCVAFGNDDVRVAGQLGSEFIVNGGKLLAMSAPGSIELNKDVLLIVLHKVIKVEANDNLYWLTVGLRKGVGFQVSDEVAVDEISNEGLRFT
jgi:hypothetical protein